MPRKLSIEDQISWYEDKMEFLPFSLFSKFPDIASFAPWFIIQMIPCDVSPIAEAHGDLTNTMVLMPATFSLTFPVQGRIKSSAKVNYNTIQVACINKEDSSKSLTSY